MKKVLLTLSTVFVGSVLAKDIVVKEEIPTKKVVLVYRHNGERVKARAENGIIHVSDDLRAPITKVRIDAEKKDNSEAAIKSKQFKVKKNKNWNTNKLPKVNAKRAAKGKAPKKTKFTKKNKVRSQVKIKRGKNYVSTESVRMEEVPFNIEDLKEIQVFKDKGFVNAKFTLVNDKVEKAMEIEEKDIAAAYAPWKQ